MPPASIDCPHCGGVAVISLPDGAATVTERHTSLRYPTRATCAQCGQAFSYPCQA